MRFFNWLFGSDGHGDSGEYNMPDYRRQLEKNPMILNEIAKRTKKSRRWTAEDMLEVVDIALMTNNYLLKLYGKNGELEQENRGLKAKNSDLEKRIRSIEQSLSILNKPYKVRQEVADWLDLLSRCREAYETVLTRMSASRKKYQQQYDETLSRQLNSIKERHDHLRGNDIQDQYSRLANKIEEFVPTFRLFGIQMCMAAEKDAPVVNPKGIDAKDDAVKNLLSEIAVEMIEPSIGESFRNTEHEKVDEKEGKPGDKGTILQVLQRGCKDKATGDIFYKAKVIVSR